MYKKLTKIRLILLILLVCILTGSGIFVMSNRNTIRAYNQENLTLMKSIKDLSDKQEKLKKENSDLESTSKNLTKK